MPVELVKAPGQYDPLADKPIMFTAGTIDMGNSEDWQQKVVDALADHDILVLNPRRDDWDSSWVQSIDNAQFREQVEWEMKGMRDSDIIIYVFLGSSQSPITLLELGLHAGDMEKNILVCCEPGYWRKGNVEVVCAYYEIPLFENMDDLIVALKESLA